MSENDTITVRAWVDWREAQGSCNACQDRTDDKIIVVELKNTTFRVCNRCAETLISSLELCLP